MIIQDTQKEGANYAMEQQASHNHRLNMPMAILFSASLVIVAVTMLVACWLSGFFLPSWIEWNSQSLKTDTNGNHEIETVVLSNHHLSIADTDGNRYVTPNDWLVSDISVGDLDADDTPEVVALLWIQERENPKYSVPFFDLLPGFSQYIYVFNYEEGDIVPVWHSKALRFDVVEIYLDKKAHLSTTLSNGNSTLWKWDDPGLSFIGSQDNLSVRVD